MKADTMELNTCLEHTTDPFWGSGSLRSKQSATTLKKVHGYGGQYPLNSDWTAKKITGSGSVNTERIKVDFIRGITLEVNSRANRDVKTDDGQSFLVTILE